MANIQSKVKDNFCEITFKNLREGHLICIIDALKVSINPLAKEMLRELTDSSGNIILPISKNTIKEVANG